MNGLSQKQVVDSLELDALLKEHAIGKIDFLLVRSGQTQSAFRANNYENSINHLGGIVSYNGEFVRV